MRKLLIFLFLCLGINGCATTTLSEAGSAVRITSSPDIVKGCHFLGEVKGSDHVNGGVMGQGAAENNSRNEIRNNAASLGANVVHLNSSNVGMGGASIHGEAYRCQ